jgi:hypothetical protein
MWASEVFKGSARREVPITPVRQLDASPADPSNPTTAVGLNMAESELAILSGQCLERRIPDQPTLEREADAWQDRRNTRNNKADRGGFAAADVRIKLKSLYPVL